MLGEHFCNSLKSLTLRIGKKSQLGVLRGGNWQTLWMIPRLFPSVMLHKQYCVDVRAHHIGLGREMHSFL